MAFLGDFGKIFLGGSSTGDVSAATADLIGFGEVGQNVARNIGQGASNLISSRDPDVSTPPAAAGVDSPATLTNLSRTSQLGRSFIDVDPRQGQGIAMNQSGFGLLAPFVTGAGRALTTGVGRNIALGVGGAAIGGAVTMFDGQGRKLIITRKMQREVKEMFMFMGGDLSATANAYSNFKMRSYTAANILAIMLKKFSSQGPFVTKAAVRKTRSTLRKMKTLADITSDLMPRKAPVRRRAASSTIKQVRNG